MLPIYPCSLTTWESLVERGRLFHQSEFPNRGRHVRVWLAAMPMCAAVEGVASTLRDEFRATRPL